MQHVGAHGAYPLELREILQAHILLCSDVLNYNWDLFIYTQVLDMTVGAEVLVAQAAGAMREAVDEWVVAVGAAIKTIRSLTLPCGSVWQWKGNKKKDKALSIAGTVALFPSPPGF